MVIHFCSYATRIKPLTAVPTTPDMRVTAGWLMRPSCKLVSMLLLDSFGFLLSEIVDDAQWMWELMLHSVGYGNLNNMTYICALELLSRGYANQNSESQRDGEALDPAAACRRHRCAAR